MRDVNYILNEGVYTELLPNNYYYNLYINKQMRNFKQKNGSENDVQLYVAVCNRMVEHVKIKGKFGTVLYEENKNYKLLDRCNFPTLYKFNVIYEQYRKDYDQIYYYNDIYIEAEWDYFIEMYVTKRRHIADVWWQCVDHPEIYTYLDVYPFKQAMMINISPDWKGKCNKQQIAILKKSIEVIGSNKNRFENYAYAIENGGDGDMVHLHCVLAFNEQQIANYKKHKNYCNAGIYKEFKTAFKRSAEVIRSNYSELNLMIDKKIINNQDMLNDKLDYLVEDKKPLSHQNKPHELFPVYYSSWG